MQRADPGSSLAGSMRLFQVAGISVYLHWSWLLVAYLEFQYRSHSYSNWIWSVAEYLSLFGIVLLHEFGHALACRQVGGRADEIVLWPLGGIAFVQPPLRPGAVLWSIAAGPLVNAVLVPLTIIVFVLAQGEGLATANPDAFRYLQALMYINLGLLIFNMLPIYPLDGGQILQALLWFIIGRATSLMVVSIIGLIATVLIVLLAVLARDIWIGIMALFVGFRCWAGLQQARQLMRAEQAGKHQGATCPSCRAHPLRGSYWTCGGCGTRFDIFTYHATCPSCGYHFPRIPCADCYQEHPIEDWYE